ncbi:phytanoyl-CoA dioxygenase, partial [Candidatus Poribacteria bacterium]
PSFHEDIYNQLEHMFAQTGNLGNNVLPLIPDIQAVFAHPVVHGAMQGVLGQNYVMHPHRYCHYNPVGSEGQVFHKDTYEGDEQVRRHRCRWTMAFYYPQDVTEDMGPTAVLPGSQYYNTDESAHAQPELALCGEAGTVTIVHYDIWHRAMPNQSHKKRYMLKFLFSRLAEPATHAAPVWHSQTSAWKPDGNGAASPLWESLWDWYQGNPNGTTNGASPAEVSMLMENLASEDERASLEAAYRLGRVGEAAVPALKQALYGRDSDARRYAKYALSNIGTPAVPMLIEALNADAECVRASAAYALADMGQTASATVPALTRAAHDSSQWVRRHAMEGLGLIGQQRAAQTELSEAVQALTTGLRDDFYWVRDNAARALAKLGALAEPAIPTLVERLEDENRYVRFHAALALKQINTPAAQDALFGHLFASRWCALTTHARPY